MPTEITSLSFIDGNETAVAFKVPVAVDSLSTATAGSVELRRYGVLLTATWDSINYMLLVPWGNVYHIQMSVASGGSPTSFPELEFSGSGNDIYLQTTSGSLDCSSIDLQDEGVMITMVIGGSPYLEFYPWQAIVSV